MLALLRRIIDGVTTVLASNAAVARAARDLALPTEPIQLARFRGDESAAAFLESWQRTAETGR
jgi:hypothetical protein